MLHPSISHNLYVSVSFYGCAKVTLYVTQSNLTKDALPESWGPWDENRMYLSSLTKPEHCLVGKLVFTYYIVFSRSRPFRFVKFFQVHMLCSKVHVILGYGGSDSITIYFSRSV